jgi:hypothetical protein
MTMRYEEDVIDAEINAIQRDGYHKIDPRDSISSFLKSLLHLGNRQS